MTWLELYDTALRNNLSPTPIRVRLTTVDDRSLEGVPRVGSGVPRPDSTFMLHLADRGKVRLRFDEVADAERLP
jgi:hypothetical protein